MQKPPKGDDRASAKDQKRSEKLSPKQRKVLQGVANGLTIEQAARNAGYSESTAKRGIAGIAKTPATAANLREAVRQMFALEEVTARLKAGCDAMEVRLAIRAVVRIQKDGPNGEVIERETRETVPVPVIDWRTRLRYLELWAKLSGLLDEPVPSGGSEFDKQILNIWKAGPVRKVEPVN